MTTAFFNVFDTCPFPILLQGETGTGKSTLVSLYAKHNNIPLTRINITGQTMREDLIGRPTLINGNVQWQDGPLTTALRNGHYILLDEINVALPEVLMTLQAILEHSNDGNLGILTIAENQGETIIPHPQCRVFATMNPPSYKYAGTKNLNTATLSRFTVVNVPNPTWEAQCDIYRQYVEDDHIALLQPIQEKILEELSTDTGEHLPPFSMREAIMFLKLVKNNIPTTDALHLAYINKIPPAQKADLVTLLEKNNLLTRTLDTAKEELEEAKKREEKERQKILKDAKLMEEKLQKQLQALQSLQPIITPTYAPTPSETTTS